MTQQWTMPAWLVLATVAVLVLLMGLTAAGARWRTRTARALAERGSETEALRRRVDEIEQLAARPATAADARDARDYVITVLGDEPARGSAPAVPPTLFADVVLRETALRSASLAHGLRRALSPEVRGRIRFEMRREVKRSRKARRTAAREALRQWQARQREVA